jgi:diguanylate cyclase (GGDEF)-like protein/PAS domain S-box-containing protein
MNLSVTLSLLLGFSAVCYFLLGVRLMSGKREIGSLPLGVTFLVIAIWVFGGAVEMMATSYVAFSVGHVGHYLGTALVPVALLMCFREFTGRTTSTRTIIALLIIPVLSIIVAATNYWHEFMWSLPATNEAGEFLTRPVEFGLWFKYVHVPYGYAVTGTSIFTLMMHSPAVAPSQRRGLFLLGGAAIVPVIGIVAYDMGIGPNTISTLPVIFAFMLPIYAWLVVGERIIEFTPLAYETVFQNMQDPVIVVDDEERIIGLNHGAETLLNMNESQALHESLESVFGAEATEVHAAISTGLPQKMLTHSGRFLHVQVTPIAATNAAARSASVLMFRDVSDVEKAQREILNSEKLLRTLIDHSVNGILRMRWITDETQAEKKELRCIFANAAAGRYLNSDSAAMIDRTVEELLRLSTTGMDPAVTENLVEQFMTAASGGKVVDTEARLETNGVAKWLRIIGEPVGEDMAITFVDVTDGKAKEERMESIARSDPLTGVLNRRGFERDAARRLSESSDDASGALLFIDLNDFKLINDQYGHEIGDQLLTIAAERLQKSLRSCDIIGRPGGDEFVALVPDVRPDIAEQLATRLTSSLEQPYLIGNKRLQCAASIGLALYPEHANTLTGLLRAADAAMYRAKARFRSGASTGDTDLLEKAVSA